MAQKIQTRFPLNVYKLRLGDGVPSSVVDISDLPYVADMTIGDGVVATLYYGNSLGQPKWMQVLSDMAVSPLEALKTSTVSGVLLVTLNQHHFALTFGYAWQRIKHVGIEPNFGIRCVLNLAKPNSLRAIRRDRVAEASLQAIEQIPDSDEIDRFGMDVEKDLLRAVKARVDEAENFGVWVAGGDSFKASVDLASESLAEYLTRCLELWGLETYRTNFEWVDNIAPIRDEALENLLIVELAKNINDKRPGLSLCAPDLLSWDDHDFFSFERRKGKSAACANYLEIAHWVEFARVKKIEIDGKALVNNFIYAYRIDGALGDKWTVLECVHGLVSLNSQSYLAHGGHWFEINDNFVARTNRKIGEIPSASLVMPCTTIKEKEGDYNARVAKDSTGYFLLMDKKLIHHGGGKSRFEVCDLFTEDGHLICVKPWGGESGGLSHLFHQARNSIELINNDKVYREKVGLYIKNVAPKFFLSWEYICDESKDAEVVLAIMRGCLKEDLPFFAKLSLVSCVDDLKKMRFKASYLVIGHG